MPNKEKPFRFQNWPAYRASEEKLGLLFLVLLGFFALVLIPNDFLLVKKPWILATMVGLRLAFFLLAGLAYAAFIHRWDLRIYRSAICLAPVIETILEVVVLLTRPSDYQFSPIPSFLIVSYSYFLWPGPSILKLGYPIVLSGIQIFFILFVKAFPLASQLVFFLTFVCLNGIGIINLVMLTKLRRVDAIYQRELQERARFKGILSDASFDALLLHRDGKVLDFNQAFLNLTDYFHEEILYSDLGELLSLAPEDQKDLTAGKTVEADLRGKSTFIPVEVHSRRISLPEGPAVSLVIRERTPEEELPSGTPQGDAADRIARLPLSKQEKAVVTQLVAGLTRNQIAEKLFISDETVKKHTQNIYRKLGLTSKTALVRLVFSGEEHR